MKKIISLALAIVLVSTLVVGCTKPQGEDPVAPTESGAMAEDQTLKISISSSPAGKFNPAISVDNTEASVTHLLFESLVKLTPEYEFEPSLATSWEVSEDSKTITMKLQDNAKWHDGTPFTAEDVAFTLKFIADKNYTGQFYSKVSAIKGTEAYKAGTATEVEGIKVIDPTTIEITTAEVYAPFFMDMSFIKIIPKHIWGAVDIATAEEQTELMLNPVGTGAFKLTKFVPDQYSTYERFDEYWGGQPKLSNVVIQVANAETAQAQLLNGETDMIDVNSMNKDDLEVYQQAGIPVHVSYWTSYRELGVNFRNKILTEKNIRKGLMHALDRQGVCDNIYDGYATVANTIYAPFFWAFPGEDQLINYDYNPEKAKELLIQGGWEYKDGKMYADGKPVKLNLLTTSSKQGDLLLVVFQENLKSIGVELVISQVEFATQLDMLRKGEGYDLFFLGNGTGNDADGRLVFHTDSIGKGNNFTGYSNPEVDRLLEEGVKYIDINERKPIYAELAKILNDELPSLFICNWGSGVATDPKLTEYVPSSNDKYYNLVNWYFAK